MKLTAKWIYFNLAYFSIKIAFKFVSQQDLLAASVCNSRHSNWVKSFNDSNEPRKKIHTVDDE